MSPGHSLLNAFAVFPARPVHEATMVASLAVPPSPGIVWSPSVCIAVPEEVLISWSAETLCGLALPPTHDRPRPRSPENVAD